MSDGITDARKPAGDVVRRAERVNWLDQPYGGISQELLDEARRSRKAFDAIEAELLVQKMEKWLTASEQRILEIIAAARGQS